MDAATNLPIEHVSSTATPSNDIGLSLREKLLPSYNALLDEIQRKIAETNALRQSADVLKNLVGERDRPAPVVLRENQFADALTPSGAAKSYLWMLGRDSGGATIDEIASALEKGGFKIKHRHGLSVALARHHEICKIGDNKYGLVAWFPGDKRRRR
jgi:hypothetical protein